MLFLLMGLAFLLMKYLAIAPVADWAWWVVLSPFALAAMWWTWADWSGYTKRRAMDREAARKATRIEKNREQLGLLPKKRKR